MAVRSIILAGLLYLLNGMFLTNACMCIPTSLSEAVCEKDFVLHAIVVGENNTNDHEAVSPYVAPFYTHYRILVLKVYKGKQKIKRIVPNSHYFIYKASIFTENPQTSSCGVKLAPFERLVLTGSIRNEKLFIHFCDRRMEWTSDMNSLMRTYFELPNYRIEKPVFP